MPPGGKVLVNGEWEIALDKANPEYIKKKRAYEEDLNFAIMGLGLGLPVVDAEGKEVSDPKEKVEILKGMGFTGNHFQQLIGDINALTEFADGESEALSCGVSVAPQKNSAGNSAAR